MQTETLTLLDLETSLKYELEANKKEILKSPWPEDLLRDYIDSEIPILNRELLEVLRSNQNLGYPEDSQPFEGAEDIFSIITGLIHDHLYVVAYAWLNEARRSMNDES